MKIEILEFFPEIKGAKQGYVDFKITYDQDKYEIFRQVAYFEKDGKKWLSFAKFLRKEVWTEKYERSPPLNNTFKEALKELDSYLTSLI